jgi:hypothetical protein
MKQKPVMFSIFVFCILLCRPAFSQEAGFSGEAPETGEESAEKKRYVIPAIGDIVISNALLFTWNRAVMRSPFSKVTFETVKEHFVWSAWEWDMDYFPTNQFAHPYQGSLYYVGAAANGFNFYESLLFAAGGSTVYEMLLETTPPSINDMVVTTVGGASLGEMFHRLYIEVDSPFMIILSPIDALNGLLTRRRPERGLSRLYNFSVQGGPGWLNAVSYGEKTGKGQTWNWPLLHVESTVIYGDPFRAQSTVPYDQFELTLGGGASNNWYEMKIVSDGYLFSFAPVNSETEQLSTGLTLSYDFFMSLNIDFFSDGLDWTVKYRRLLADSTALEIKAHAGWLGLGASNYYLYEDRTIPLKSYRDYGTGTNAKLFFSLVLPRGRLSLDIFSYTMFIVSHRIRGSRGWDFFNHVTASYTFPLGKNFFLGLADTVTIQNSRYESAPRVDRYTNSFRIFAGWTFDGPERYQEIHSVYRSRSRTESAPSSVSR